MYKILNCSCKDCKYRRVGCHAICKKYKDYIIQLKQIKKYSREDKFKLHTEGYYNSFIKYSKHFKNLHDCKS
jgi:hypothetical protein